MTITVKLNRKGPIKLRSDGSRHGQITYLCTSDTISEDQDAILDHASIPTQHVNTHPDNGKLVCRETEVQEYEGNDWKWLVTAEFDSRNQLDRPKFNEDQNIVEGGMNGITEDVPTFWDTNGDPLVNAADDYYEGLTKRKRLIQIPITAYYKNTIPWALFETVNGTVNDAAITVHGRTFPAGIGLFENPRMPERPFIDDAGANFWQVKYMVTLNPDGWITILPNRGFMHYLYQTRALATDDFSYSGFDAYTAETDSNLKRRLKVNITEDGESDIPERIWLNDHGEKMLAGLTVISGTGDTTAGSASVTNISPVLTADDVGKYIVITGAGREGRKHRARIVTQAGGSCTIEPVALTAQTGGAIKGGGAYCKTYQIDDLEDWSSVLLPNNQ